VGEKAADDKGWRVGTALPVTFADGKTDRFTVGAVYKNDDVAGDVLLSRAAWAPHAVQDVDNSVLVKLRAGDSVASACAAVERLAGAYGGPYVEDRKEYVASLNQCMNMMHVIMTLQLA